MKPQADSTPEGSLSPRPLYRQAMRAAWLGVFVNLGLGGIKLFGGIAGNSFGLISDSVNSLGDSLTSVVTLMALWYAQQPADEEHPYGHTRVETVAGAYLSLFIVASALYVGWEAFRRMGAQHQIPPEWTLWIAAGNVAIKESLYRYKRNVGRRTGSTSILASAVDHRSDALCSLAVLIGLGVIRWGGPAWIWADEVAALVVVAAILWTGGRMLQQSTSELLDPQADSEVVAHIRQLAEEIPDVRAVEKLWVRKTGIEYLVDIHIQVDARLTVDEGHRIGHLVKRRLVSEIAAVRDVLVHLEPWPHMHGPGE
ncbi:MAG: cation transporter [Planctomyces sp.]|nr:cation transporter [Planctomyces sp.]